MERRLIVNIDKDGRSKRDLILDKYGRSSEDYIRAHPASFTVGVFIQESDVFAIDADGKTVAEGEAGVDDASVIQAAVDSLNKREVLVMIGDFTVNKTIVINEGIKLFHYGQLTLLTDGFKVGDASNRVGYPQLNLDTIAGNAQNITAIHVQNADSPLITFNFISNGTSTKGKAIFLEIVSDNWINQARILGGNIVGWEYGLLLDETGGAGYIQGTLANIRFITGCLHGVYVSGASFNTFIGDIDNSNANGMDIEEVNGAAANTYITSFSRPDYVSIANSYYIQGNRIVKAVCKDNFGTPPDQPKGLLTAYGAGAIELWRDDGVPYIDFKDSPAVDFDARIIKTPTHALQFQTGGSGSIKTPLVLEADGHVNATNFGVKTKRFVGDYGGTFANFTPPAGEEGLMIVAIDTNATAPGKRLYVYANGAWNYVDLT